VTRLDATCAWLLFALGVVHVTMTPAAVRGRLWFFGTGLTLIFAAMINLLRIKNGYSVRWLKPFCVGANLMTLTLAVFAARALWVSLARYPQVFLIVAVVAMELLFSIQQQNSSR
jgi:hypothetical protein